MKKHNEGYVLAFVLIVVAVLALISTAVSTVAVRNMETQQAAVKLMQDKYEVEGQIEQVLANINSITTLNPDTGESTKAEMEEQIKKFCLNTDVEIKPDANNADITVKEEEKTDFSYKFILTAEKGNQKVTSTVELKGKIIKNEEDDTCTISEQNVTYLEFETSTVETTASTTNPSEGGAAE